MKFKTSAKFKPPVPSKGRIPKIAKITVPAMALATAKKRGLSAATAAMIRAKANKIMTGGVSAGA